MHSPVPASLTRRISSLQDARLARVARKQLCEELDSYRTPAERAELDAILSRHTAAELDHLAAMTGRRYAA